MLILITIFYFSVGLLLELLNFFANLRIIFQIKKKKLRFLRKTFHDDRKSAENNGAACGFFA